MRPFRLTPARQTFVTWASVCFTREGWHCWPAAPEHRAYLRASHRHLFHVEVRITVTHHDREIEYHDLLDFCRGQFPGGDLGPQSCEALAARLRAAVMQQWPGRRCGVHVFEDGECGAIVEDAGV